MEDLVASRTALATARMRAIHSRHDAQPILDDPWGYKLVPLPLLRSMVELMATPLGIDVTALSDVEIETLADDFLRGSSAYANVIVRSRYTEDALHDAIGRGFSQYVLLGAGFDSYALRKPPQAAGVVVYEIDHPATQSLKQQQIASCGISIGPDHHFLPANLATQSLASVLADSAFRKSEPAFISWLGVTMYLSREDNMAALDGIARSCASGSELAFSYVDQNIFDAPDEAEIENLELLEQSVQAMGEPFLSGFYPATLAADIAPLGLDLLEDLPDSELVTRYDGAGANGLHSVRRSHVALVRVVREDN